MITSRDIKFIFMGILIFLLSRYLYDRFFRPQKRPPRKKQKKSRIVQPLNIKEKC
jgi:hypothetical protein